jgi:hypothetical protein
MNFKPFYFPLDENQLALMRAMSTTLILQSLIISKQVLPSVTDIENKNLFCIPLTPDQVRFLQHSILSKNSLTLNFSFHQIQQIAKVNFNMDIDIKDHIIKHQTKKRIFRKMSK